MRPKTGMPRKLLHSSLDLMQNSRESCTSMISLEIIRRDANSLFRNILRISPYSSKILVVVWR